jgi:hypothetical protein
MSKKIIIPRSQLPDINSITNSYQIRFRITTEDRNRFSAWSEIFQIDPGFVFVPGASNIATSGSVTTVIWDAVNIQKTFNGVESIVGQAQQYDVWTRWTNSTAIGIDPDYGDWVYRERITNTSINFLKPPSYTHNGEIVTGPNATIDRLFVAVYARGNPIIRSSNLLLYSFDNHAV